MVYNDYQKAITKQTTTRIHTVACNGCLIKYQLLLSLMNYLKRQTQLYHVDIFYTEKSLTKPILKWNIWTLN